MNVYIFLKSLCFLSFQPFLVPALNYDCSFLHSQKILTVAVRARRGLWRLLGSSQVPCKQLMCSFPVLRKFSCDMCISKNHFHNSHMAGSRLECRQGWLEAWQESKTTLSAHPRPCRWFSCLPFIYRKEVKVLSSREHPPLSVPPGNLTLSKEENENCSRSGVVDRTKK